MMKSLEKSARTVDEALRAALAELGLDVDDISYTYEIVTRPKSGFLGIGAVPAVVRVSYEAPDEPKAKVERKPEPKPAVEKKPEPKPEKKPEPKVEKKPEPKPEKKPEAPKPEKKAEPKAEKKAEALKPEKKPEPKAEKKPEPRAPKKERKPEPKAPAEITPASPEDEEAVRAFLSGLLERMGVTAEIELAPRANGGLSVNLAGSGLGAIIGRRGETLDAIQHLTNYVVNHGSEKHLHISVDAENYRSKREESLVHLAEKMAEKAIKYKRSMALEPMNSYERHVIHTALQNYEGVTTSSTGVEPNRRVVVSYVRPETPNNKPQSREWA